MVEASFRVSAAVANASRCGWERVIPFQVSMRSIAFGVSSAMRNVASRIRCWKSLPPEWRTEIEPKSAEATVASPFGQNQTEDASHEAVGC